MNIKNICIRKLTENWDGWWGIILAGNLISRKSLKVKSFTPTSWHESIVKVTQCKEKVTRKIYPNKRQNVTMRDCQRKSFAISI